MHERMNDHPLSLPFQLQSPTQSTMQQVSVLVTGGSGLVGSALRSVCGPELKYRFTFASSRDCDLTDYDATLRYFRMVAPHAVIHLAAAVGGLFKNMRCKADMFETNARINMNVLRVCHELGVSKLVSCLSTCIFPDDKTKTEQINESMLHAGPPHESNYAYAHAKRMLEVQSRCYREQHGRNFVCVVPTNIYGPHDNFHLDDAHVIPALIHKCYLAKQQGRPLVVAGSGAPLRQFIYSRDLALLLIWALEHYDATQCNDGAGAGAGTLILSVDPADEISIAQVVQCITEVIGLDNDIVYDTSQPDGQFKKTADNAKFKRIYGAGSPFAFTPIRQGILETVRWFVQNYDLARK
jgi:GDP-L-fucose synthase